MSRYRKGGTASLDLNKAAYAAVLKAVPRLKADTAEGYRFSEEMSIPVLTLGVEGLKALEEHYAAVGEKAKATQVQGIRKVVEAPDQTKIGRLRNLEPAAKLVIGKIPNRWLFKRDDDGVPHAYLVTGIEYTEADASGETYIPAYVTFKMSYWDSGEISNNSFSVRTDDIKGGKTVEQFLLDQGYMFPTPDLLTQYEEMLKRYEGWWSTTGLQLRGKGKGIGADYSRGRITLGAGGNGDRVVTDCEEQEKKGARSLQQNSWGGEDSLFPLPVHPYLYCFNLVTHDYMWIHVFYLKEHVYTPELKEKLVLPEDHKDLIDVLTADAALLAEDMIEGKSGGVVVVCQGDPGTGKTLTAEVYAEVVKKPLYKLHSGQLGTDPESVEKSLIEALQRAERWKALMLIDEADVYLRARAQNLEQNAVVGVFLRTLEYFNGILFLTTNRGQDIDDAILSRAVAVIQYQRPQLEERRRLWTVLSKQFGVDMDAKLIDESANKFDNVAGRDIKALLKLSAMYINVRKEPMSLNLLTKSAIFRGIK